MDSQYDNSNTGALFPARNGLMSGPFQFTNSDKGVRITRSPTDKDTKYDLVITKNGKTLGTGNLVTVPNLQGKKLSQIDLSLINKGMIVARGNIKQGRNKAVPIVAFLPVVNGKARTTLSDGRKLPFLQLRPDVPVEADIAL